MTASMSDRAPSDPQPVKPTVRRGRRPSAELVALRGRIEALMLGGLRSPAIHRALTGLDNPSPAAVSQRGIRGHMRAIERSWRERASADSLEQDRAAELAKLDDVMRAALTRSTMHAGSNLGVGYLNVYLKANERFARMRGLDAPVRQELSGPGGGPIELSAIRPLRSGPTNLADELERLDLRRAELEMAIGFATDNADAPDAP